MLSPLVFPEYQSLTTHRAPAPPPFSSQPTCDAGNAGSGARSARTRAAHPQDSRPLIRATATAAPSLRKNTVWTLAGNLVHAAAQWGMIIVIARLGGTTMLASYALVLALVTPLFQLSNLNLRSICITDTPARFTPRDYLVLRGLTGCFALALVFVSPLLWPQFWHLFPLMAALSLVRVAEAFSDILHGFHHQREQMKLIAVARASRALLSLVMVTVLLYYQASLALSVTGVAVVHGLFLLLMDIPNAKRIPGRVSAAEGFPPVLARRRVTALLLLALPLGLNAALLALNSNLPRYVIAYYLDAAELAYFAAAAYLLVITDLIVRSAHQTALPRLAKLAPEGRLREFRLVLLKLVFLGCLCAGPLLVVVWLGGGDLLGWIYGSEYRRVADVFLWLMVANVVWHTSIPTTALLALRYYWSTFAIRAGSTLLILAAAIIWVPSFGLLGAAWAVLAGKTATAVGTAVVTVWALRRFRPCKVLDSFPSNQAIGPSSRYDEPRPSEQGASVCLRKISLPNPPQLAGRPVAGDLFRKCDPHAFPSS